MIEEYLTDADNHIHGAVQKVSSSSDFRSIFKTALATDAVLSKIRNSANGPSIVTLRELIRRIPLLIFLGQITSASIELRQFIELAFWNIFFSDHPVEWDNFVSNPTKGYVRDIDKPISYLANREILFYANYIKERFSNEPSGLAIGALEVLNYERNKLNAIVHPAPLATRQKRLFPFENISDIIVADFNKRFKIITSNACILLCAYNRKSFDKFPALSRAWFDWLIGSEASKFLRSNSFGLISK